MNDKRICELMLPMWLLQYHLHGDPEARKITKFINLVFKKSVDSDKKEKLKRRLDKRAFEILELLASKENVSGHKLLRFLFYFTGNVFEKKAKTTFKENEIFILRKTEFVLNYALWLEHKYRYSNLKSERDFSLLDLSAEKFAEKMFKKFYS
jgi:hypothetical protein